MTEISLQEYCKQIEDTIKQGRYAEAVAHGKHILKHYPKYATTYRLLGQAMLEAEQDEYAADMFRRVLSANPEDLTAWAGMSEVCNRRGELDAAVWYLERAFELATDNPVVEGELRHLYGQRDGLEPHRVQLTRGALARLYLKGDLLSRAIGELRALLTEHPERVDLGVALAEALWRNEQRLEASEVCQKVLDELPYCLKANLILGEIWTSSGREEGQMYLRRVEALDPENLMAQELFGPTSPLPAREMRIVPLEYKPPTEEERPAWMTEIEAVTPPPTERETALVDITTALEAQIEIPPWLEEIGVGEEVTAPLTPAPPEKVPEWLAGLREEFVEETPEAVAEAEVPEWLAAAGVAAALEEREKEEAVPSAPPAEPLPDWLVGLRGGFAEEVEAPEEAAPATVTPAPAEIPDWLQEIAPPEAMAPVEEAAAPPEAPPLVEEEAPLPAWLEGEGIPSGDEALAWLEQLAAGKEEELRAQAKAEGEIRMAEIMGRPRPAVTPPAEAIPEEVVAPPVEEAPLVVEAPVMEEIPPVEKAAPPEAPPLVEEEAPLPAWLEGEEVPSGDEALAWLEQLAAGKEEELRAQAKAEGEIRMAEIMGRPRPAVTPPKEALPEEVMAPPVEEAPPVELAFGWTAFGEVGTAPLVAPPVMIEEAAPPEAPEEVEAPPVFEAPAVEEWPPLEEVPAPEVAPPTEEIRWGAALAVTLEEEVAPAPVIEEVPGVSEMEITEPLEEAAPPPEVPAVEVPTVSLVAERAYLKEHPRDYETWLALAQALWQADEREEALEAYTRVIRAGKFLESVIPDLEEHTEQWPHASTQRVLGDAYMRAGRLQEALDTYRRALETL